MNDVRSWAIIVCMVALISSLMQYLTPSGSMERMLKLVLGAFVVCSILLPLTKIVPQLSLDWQGTTSSAQDTQNFENTVDSQIYSAANSGIKTIVLNELNTMNIKCKNVEVMMDTNEDGSISISKVVVTLDSAYSSRCAETAAHLEKVLGLKTEVTPNGSE